MHHCLSVQQLNTIKTEKCQDTSCPIYNMFSNEIRAKHYKLIYQNDKLSLNCFGYHSDFDKRRAPLQNKQNSNHQQLIYSPQYFIDLAKVKKVAKNNQNSFKKSNQSNPQKYSQNLTYFNDKCHNFVEYVYHPQVYKTIQCPNDTKKQQDKKMKECNNKYCPFIHENQKLGLELNQFLALYQKKNAQRQNNIIQDKKQNPNTQNCKKSQQLFANKIQSILALKNIKLFLSEQQRQNINKEQNPNGNLTLITQKNYYASKQDQEQINKLKQKFKLNVQKCFIIDKQKQLEQESRKVTLKKNNWKQKSDSNELKNIPKQKNNPDKQPYSYNYFNYGEKVPLMESRTVQFKHFKDISDPNHIPLIMKYISAFLNSEGGKLYIGIDDNSYVYGAKFKQSQYDKLLLNIDREGKFSMNPPLMPQKYEIKLIPVYHDKKGQQRWVIQITVFPPSLQNKKLFLYNRQCYMRMNASTHKLNASDLIQFFSLNPNVQNPNDFSEPIIQRQEVNKQQSDQKAEPHKIQQKQGNKRENQLINDKAISIRQKQFSQSKFRTEQSKVKQFQDNLNKKSIEQLYLLKKDYESKLNIIIQTYKRKQRQMR